MAYQASARVSHTNVDISTQFKWNIEREPIYCSPSQSFYPFKLIFDNQMTYLNLFPWK